MLAGRHARPQRAQNMVFWFHFPDEQAFHYPFTDRIARVIEQTLSIVFLTGVDSVKEAVQAMKKGAFTGANYRKLGKLEAAKGGTFFLDEIGNLELNLQSKLLRVFKTRQFERLGGNSSLLADFRLITASNSNLAEKVQTGEFRSDLHYRINVFTIEVPAVREHPEDIPEYIQYFVGLFNAKHGKQISGASSECMQILRKYSWPGNIRQLRNTIERAVLLSDSVLLPEHLSDDVTGIAKGAAIASEALDNMPLHALEERALRTALRSSGDKTRAAAELGISLRTLYYWLKKYKISTANRQT